MSPELVLAEDPACNPACRSCHYKALDYPSQLDRKRGWARECWGRWGAALEDIRPAPGGERLGYRSKTWLLASWRDGRLSFGMIRSVRRQGRWAKDFVSQDGCPLLAPPLRGLIAKLAALLPRQAFGFVGSSLVGVWLASPHLVIVSRHPDIGELSRVDWSELLLSPFTQIWFHCNPEVGWNVFGRGDIVALAGAPAGPSAPVRAFRQVAQSLLVEARRAAAAFLLQGAPKLVLDLYCGSGELGALLEPEVGWLGIELGRDAVSWAQASRAPGRALHAAFLGKVEQRLRDPSVLGLIDRPYAIYLNPPRSGLGEEARAALLSLAERRPPKGVAYLSCSASRLAADLKSLELAGFRVKSLQPFDFFPQTEHFEILALLAAP
jgi:tRNA/tmRNA/rRNA uracil-C5-methylase (TrmA/RlmC/RlmD family)